MKAEQHQTEIKFLYVDSSVSNLGKSSPRHYYGADVQFKIHHEWGETELRAEHWFGTQPGTAIQLLIPEYYQTQMDYRCQLMSGISMGPFFIFFKISLMQNTNC